MTACIVLRAEPIWTTEMLKSHQNICVDHLCHTETPVMTTKPYKSRWCTPRLPLKFNLSVTTPISSLHPVSTFIYIPSYHSYSFASSPTFPAQIHLLGPLQLKIRPRKWAPYWVDSTCPFDLFLNNILRNDNRHLYSLL